MHGRRRMGTENPIPAGGQVIRRKITVPPAPARLSARERLDRLILELVARHPLVWVCATAGSGKTTAVSHALERQDRPVAWLTLDDTDAAAGRLVTYLEATLAAQVEPARGVATQALAARLPHPEAAVLLVVDELERIAEAPDALAVISAILRYAPPAMRVVLISRVQVAIEVDSTAALGGSATITDSDLAFRSAEAARALELAGRRDIDPSHAVEVTGGWVAGVLFEAWRSAEHVAGIGGEADALHGYLS